MIIMMITMSYIPKSGLSSSHSSSNLWNIGVAIQVPTQKDLEIPLRISPETIPKDLAFNYPLYIFVYTICLFNIAM